MRDKAKAPEPMDDSVRERAVGAPKPNNPRVCGAIKQLVAEFTGLFPETPVEYSNYDGRNTALDVTFDLTALDEDTDRVDALNLMIVLGDETFNTDPRIDYVLASQTDGAAVVSMKSSLRTQDLRDSFGLAEAYSILSGEAEGYDTEDDSGWTDAGNGNWTDSMFSGPALGGSL
jgi:hypothetical protein